MSHDPCAVCGGRDGEILIDGDAPPLTFCSTKCLTEWAEDQSEDRYLCTDTHCKETYWESEIDSENSVRVCPHCGRYEKQYPI